MSEIVFCDKCGVSIPDGDRNRNDLPLSVDLCVACSGTTSLRGAVAKRASRTILNRTAPPCIVLTLAYLLYAVCTREPTPHPTDETALHGHVSENGAQPSRLAVPDAQRPSPSEKLGASFSAILERAIHTFDNARSELEYDTALQTLQDAAQVENAEAIHEIAWRLDNGDRIRKSTAAAVRLYTISAGLGLSKSMYNLGIHYESVADISTAFEWFARAADAGDKDAKTEIHRLGATCLKAGKSDLAIQYLRKGVELGSPQSMYTLAMCYLEDTGRLEGVGVSRDEREAVRLLEVAAKLGDAQACLMLGNIYTDKLSSHYSPNDGVAFFIRAGDFGEAVGYHNAASNYRRGDGVEFDAKKCLIYYEKSVALGCVESCAGLGECLLYGHLDVVDHDRALRLLLRAADDVAYVDRCYAEFYVAQMYEFGLGVNADPKKALHYLERGADHGCDWAQFYLAVRHIAKGETGGDYGPAMSLLEAACRQGHVRSAFNLGMLYYEGRATRRNTTLAIKWLTFAAERGDLRSQYNLGYIYHYGEGVRVDKSAAKKWYKLAAANGSASAKEGLENLARGAPASGVGALVGWALGASDRIEIWESTDTRQRISVPSGCTMRPGPPFEFIGYDD